MSTFKLEKGVPIPLIKIGRPIISNRWTDMIEGMEVSDSFLIPIDMDNEDERALEISKMQTRFNGGMKRHRGRNSGFSSKFVTRTVEGGLRVWRTE